MEVDCKATPVDLHSKPLCLLVLGFAGSGKSSFVKSLKEYLSDNDKMPYTINLDPAVHALPYTCNIDIQDTIKYKDVMAEYNLGPNGAIITSLNLFSTSMNDVVGLIDKNAPKINTVIIDTPGQIEVFKWSASGRVITEALAGSMPTALIYVIDTVRSVSPLTFMANMMYAVGLAIENELPFIMVMNKIDIVNCSYLDKWMNDTLAFIEDMEAVDTGYMSNTVRQFAFSLEKFYSDLKRVGVSSMTKEGMKEFVDMLPGAREEYFDNYVAKVVPQKISNKEEYADSIFITNQLDEEEEASDLDEGDDFDEDDDF